VLLVVLGASPAGAHPILLRTEPMSQTTLSSSPATIRLDFSEPVETAFGAIRVFGPDGKPADVGPVGHANEDHDVFVAPPPLKGGTYRVTWHVVSHDGHSVHGGFQFNVGAPSAITPVVGGEQKWAPTSVTWGFGVVRFTWFASLFALIGMVAIRRWVWTPAVRAADLATSSAAQRFRHRFGVFLPVSLALVLASGVVALVFQAATVSGLSLVSSASPSVLRKVFHTTYGRVWLAQAALALALALPVAGLARRRGVAGVRPDVWIAVGGVLVAGLCVAAALNGHARTDPRPELATAAVAVHLLAGGLWVGGLAALVALGLSSARSLPATDRVRLLGLVVPRFSRLAIAGVVVVVTTGVINSIGTLDGLGDLWRVAYGRVLVLKVALLVLALGLAWRHLRLPRHLGGPGAIGAARAFGRTSTLESVVLAGAIAVAAALGVLVPGRSLALAADGPVNQSQRAGTYTVRLSVDPSAPGANEIHLSFVNASGPGVTAVTNATAVIIGDDGVIRRLALRLLTGGQFVADADLSVPGPWRLEVTGSVPPARLFTTFGFRLADPAKP